jgi:hypothetical protein
MWLTLPGRSKSTLHTSKKLSDGIATIVITHPFHPDRGNSFECLGQTKKHVKCLDERGNIRLFPINITNLYIATISERSADGSYIASVDDLLALKELIDSLSHSQLM